MTLDALIEALEKATKPVWRLESEIACHLPLGDGEVSRHQPWGQALAFVITYTDGSTKTKTPPRYMRSLDAALTLVPEGWHVIHAFWNAKKATVNLTFELPPDPNGVRRYASATAPTPALALTLACMKARKP